MVVISHERCNTGSFFADTRRHRHEPLEIGHHANAAIQWSASIITSMSPSLVLKVVIIIIIITVIIIICIIIVVITIRPPPLLVYKKQLSALHVFQNVVDQ